jgi:hypothetical protein
MFRTAAALAILASLAAPPVAAGDDRAAASVDEGQAPAITANAARKFMVLSEPLAEVPAAGPAADVADAPIPLPFAPAHRGAALPSLYVSLAGLNAVDAYTTMKGLSGGATEANPLMKTITKNPAAFLAVKGGVTAGSILVAERLWRKGRRAQAIAVMVVSNGVMAAVAARNVSVLRQQ